MHSLVEEDYLKAIFKHSTPENPAVSTSSIARELNVQSASVTDMLKKLSTKGLVRYEKYQGVELTSGGRSAAVAIVRKHRLWEVFLVEKLGFKWSEVHDLAEQLEHIHSEELIDRLDHFLGNPRIDPHGDPIPDKSGFISPQSYKLLSELAEGARGVLVGVSEDSRDLLQYLEQNQLLLGTPVSIEQIFPFDGSRILVYPQGRLSISRQVAESLFVS